MNEEERLAKVIAGEAPPRSVFEAFGHNELCDKWIGVTVNGEERMTLAKDLTCTCGERELTAAEKQEVAQLMQ